ncbi:hypothetical protein BOX15_Mlig002319g1 [Macrostomum lignano]|uniref:Major facilitator superfamily (MFS) profile domain-containing protein n=1 Tax=Macrostomum lignano TaxID=282301 RepID=A0A267GZE7_9PLAT|nr:hypothetical protein BOX15_Mlig002319g1 [Macrostomum lignano]
MATRLDQPVTNGFTTRPSSPVPSSLRLGRRRCLIACLCLYGSAALGSAFCQSPVAMALTRFFIGFGAMGAFTVSFVIGTEIVGPEARFHTGMAIEYFWTLGSCAVAGLAYLIHDWRHLQLVLSAPVLLVLVASLPPAVVPESPRWLLHKGRVNEARDVIRRMARLNRATVDIGRELDSVLEGDGPDNGGGGGRSTEKVTPSLTEASTDCAAVRVDDGSGQRSEPRWRHRFRAAAVAARQLICQAPRLLAEYCIICFNWFSIALVYYGLIMGSGTLPGSIFLTSLLTAMVEFPAYILGHATVNRLGRKVVCVAFNSLSAVSLFGLLLVVLLAPDLSWLIITLSMLGKLFNTTAFGVIYLWTAELYPTSIRNIGVSTSSMCARIGTLFAPALADIDWLSRLDGREQRKRSWTGRRFCWQQHQALSDGFDSNTNPLIFINSTLAIRS